MKKINDKGFTLIELLAVIVIMGILMMVAIPAVSRTIENSRKDTFMDIAKSYADAAKTLWSADGLSCTVNGESLISSATPDGEYYIEINSAGKALNGNVLSGTAVSTPTLLDQGGKSSWGNRDVLGYVRVNVANEGAECQDASGATATCGTSGAVVVKPGKRVTKFYIKLSDGIHGVMDDVESSQLTRGRVQTSGFAYSNGELPSNITVNTCVES